MALTQFHRYLFLEECSRLTRLVCGCLETLEKNPSDSASIEKMVNTADVIRGGAKFLQDEELEQSAKILIELFKGAEDVRERQKEFELICGLFRKLANKFLSDQIVSQ
jgi:chemotaxis protein histidine kinase CheA